MKTLIQDKIKRRFSTTKEHTKSGLLHADGSFTDVRVRGMSHKRVCWMVGCSLQSYMRQGGLRIFLHADSLAIEGLVNQPTIKQITRLKQIVRANGVFSLTVSFSGDYRCQTSFNKITAGHLMEVLRCFTN